jgi:hypothetical protein
MRRRQWYIYAVGALLYASAMWLGYFWLFLVGTAVIFAAVIIGEVDGKAASKAAREAQERRQ